MISGQRFSHIAVTLGYTDANGVAHTASIALGSGPPQ
jgi:hypothetical protein